jgi:hypothetical protein
LRKRNYEDSIYIKDEEYILRHDVKQPIDILDAGVVVLDADTPKHDLGQGNSVLAANSSDVASERVNDLPIEHWVLVDVGEVGYRRRYDDRFLLDHMLLHWLRELLHEVCIRLEVALQLIDFLHVQLALLHCFLHVQQLLLQ